MEQSISTSKVTVEYFDSHGLYNLIAPGLAARLPLRHLHWQSHSGPLRSIDTLHVELVAAGTNPSSTSSQPPVSETQNNADGGSAAGVDHGFQLAPVSGQSVSADNVSGLATVRSVGKERRHQIPGLRRTPYLKVLLVRCDDNETYKSHTRSEIREWVKENTAEGAGKKPGGVAENHDAFEWMIIHVVIPNSAAYAQSRTNRPSDGSASDLTSKSTSRWGKSSSTILERLRSDFSSGSSAKVFIDRVAQIRLSMNDVPYDMLPQLPPAVLAGYAETEKDAQASWAELIDKFKTLILSSFDVRVSQYEDDIREKDMQRSLPGWNFCTFFILKEGLARGFESVGLVEDALVGYDELGVGLDTVVKEQENVSDTAASHAGAFLAFTDDLKALATKTLSPLDWDTHLSDDGDPVDLQANETVGSTVRFDELPISSTKKPYRDLILANNVSVFDFRCYIFSRQISLLLRLGNASSSCDDPVGKLEEQGRMAVGDAGGVFSAGLVKPVEEVENLAMLAEICRRTLEFIPAVSQVMREDILHAISRPSEGEHPIQTPTSVHAVDNVVASFAFSIAQQILSQTSTKALPIPHPTGTTVHGNDSETTVPEPKTVMHPSRSSSLQVRGPPATHGGPPPSPGIFPSLGQQLKIGVADGSRFLKLGLEELAARRADLYMLSRNILEDLGKKRGWISGWANAPFLDNQDSDALKEVSLAGGQDDQANGGTIMAEQKLAALLSNQAITGSQNSLLHTALQSEIDFYRLYEVLTDKALRHYTVSGHTHSVHSNLADLAVLKYHLRDFASAASYFHEATPFFGESGWSHLELAMLAMYARCLKEMGKTEELVLRLIKLLAKAARAEKDRFLRRSLPFAGLRDNNAPFDKGALKGYLEELLTVSSKMVSEVRTPLANFFTNVEVQGTPTFTDGQDSFSVALHLHSFLSEQLPVDSVQACMVLAASTGGQTREIWLETRTATSINPGKNKIQLHSNTTIPGTYEVDKLRITSGKLTIWHDRKSAPPTADANILKEPHVVLYQRTSSLDIRLSTSKDLQLHKNNYLELELLTGWNDVLHCEVRVRAATGGLRLLVSEAKVVGDTHTLRQPVEGGVLEYGAIDTEAIVKTSFPFSIEQDVLDLCVRVEVTYTTKNGVFSFAKSPSVSTSLALGVNVQDVFKHDALFCRFTVSTATTSPLRVFQSEVHESDLFAAQFGGLPGTPSIAFLKQPVSLLYRIIRKPGSDIGPGTKKTMCIKLHYSVLIDEINAQLQLSLENMFRDAPSLYQFYSVVMTCVLRYVQTVLSPNDLERAAILGELSTSFVAGGDWAKAFPGLGFDSSGERISTKLAESISAWQDRNPTIPIPQPDPLGSATRTISIPVDIPSVTIVHTADIQLQGPPASLVPFMSSLYVKDKHKHPASTPIFSVNQLLPATLQLKWTRLWDTGSPNMERSESGRTGTLEPEDLEFSFEVTAPTDAWLIGGRRKGHFVIPAPSSEGGVGWTSTPECEATIPLMLVPLREGWLPYPNVDIREVVSDGTDAAKYSGLGGDGAHAHMPHSMHHHETDYRNLGETVRVVADRSRVTLSLDASGPGGGPLVLKSERTHVEGRVVV